MSKLRSIFTVVAMLLTACCGWAQERGYSLSGRVVDINGKGIGKATVRLIVDGDSTSAMSTDTYDDGRFAFNGLVSG